MRKTYIIEIGNNTLDLFSKERHFTQRAFLSYNPTGVHREVEIYDNSLSKFSSSEAEKIMLELEKEGLYTDKLLTKKKYKDVIKEIEEY